MAEGRTFLKKRFSQAQNFSMGLSSGEYGGRNRSLHPAFWVWNEALSITIMVPCSREGKSWLENQNSKRLLYRSIILKRRKDPVSHLCGNDPVALIFAVSIEVQTEKVEQSILSNERTKEVTGLQPQYNGISQECHAMFSFNTHTASCISTAVPLPSLSPAARPQELPATRR